MRNIFFLLLLFTKFYPAWSTNTDNYSDSILKALPTIKYDSVRIKAYINLSEHVKAKDFDLALAYMNKALAISSNETEKAKCLYYLGKVYSSHSKWSQSDSCLMASNKIFTKLNRKSNMGFCYEYLGTNGYYQGNYIKAIDNYLKSLKLREELNDIDYQMKTLSNIGTVYKEQRDPEKALDYYLQAEKLSNKVDDRKFEASVLNNIGIIYKIMDNSEKALDKYKLAIEIFKEIGDRKLEANTYNNIAIIYDENKEFPKAKLYYNKALKIFEEEKYDYGIILVSTNLAEMMNDFGDYKSAINYAQKSLISAIEMELKDDQKLAYKSLSRSYAKMGDYKNAYKYHVLYSNQKDSIFNETASLQIAEMQTKYDTEKKEAENNLLKTEQALDKAEIDKKSSQQNLLIFVLGVALLIVVYVVYSLNQKKKINKVLNTQNQIIEEKNKDITDSITYAKRIQQAILPSLSSLQNYYDSFIYYQPKDIVAGDFYWIEKIGNQILFAAADCTGHGVPGAMVSVVCHNALNRAVREFNLTQPSKILDKVTELVIETFEKSDNEVKDGMDIALCALNPNTNELEYSGANNSIYIISKGELTEIKADKQPIGKYAYSKAFVNHKITLQKSDTIYIFSDGYADQFGGEKGKKFKYSRFKNLLLELYDNPMKEQLTVINRKFNSWKGKLEQVDDVCVIGVKI